MSTETSPDFALSAGVARYRKRPVEIEAAQWDGTAEGATPIINWILSLGGNATYRCIVLDEAEGCPGGDENHTLAIHTIEGTMDTQPGGYVIKGLANEFYPHAPDPLWSKAYEPVEETDRP